MLKKLVFLGLALPLLATCIVDTRDAEYEVTTLVLPQGHPEAGRDAFMTLGCNSCHSVTWEPALPEPVAKVDAPELGPHLGNLTTGSVLTSIIAPSHFVPREIRASLEDRHSPMADFTEAMTVRQLIDLVAYLRTRGGSTVAGVHATYEESTLPHHL